MNIIINEIPLKIYDAGVPTLLPIKYIPILEDVQSRINITKITYQYQVVQSSS